MIVNIDIIDYTSRIKPPLLMYPSKISDYNSGSRIILPLYLTSIYRGRNVGEKRSQISPDFSKSKDQIFVVLADDDVDDRDFFSEALEETGLSIRLEMAEDGESLLKLLKSNGKQPDLIFLDLNMPNKNGRECLDEIRKSPDLKHIPIIIYSTSSAKRDIDDTFEKGANLYVSKPSSFNELKEIASLVLSLDWGKLKPNSSKETFVFSKKSQ